MEQVKQTFRFFLSLFLLITSPPQSISFTGNISFLGFIEPMKERMRICVVLFQDFIIVRSVELLFFKFQVLRKQSEAKE